MTTKFKNTISFDDKFKKDYKQFLTKYFKKIEKQERINEELTFANLILHLPSLKNLSREAQ